MRLLSLMADFQSSESSRARGSLSRRQLLLRRLFVVGTGMSFLQSAIDGSILPLLESHAILIPRACNFASCKSISSATHGSNGFGLSTLASLYVFDLSLSLPFVLRLDSIALVSPSVSFCCHFDRSWSCMPQGVRTVEEHVDYVTMMSRVGMLYLGCSALLLVDGSYLSRFWTQCEAWWSMQKCTANGLSSARGSERRWTVVCIHLAQPKIEGVKLEEVWSTASPADAFVTLSSPDVGITNDSDKDVQLPRVLRLDEVVRSAFKSGSAQLQAQIDAYRAGEALYFAGASEVFANGDRLTHGQRGEVVGPSTSVALKGKGLAMRFPGNNEFVNCYLSTLSANDPPPLPGGHWVGEKLFFTGSSQTFADGERLTHGQKGLVVGPATAETHRGNGLAVAFPGNKASVNCYLNSLSTDAPPPLPGGHALGAKLFCTGPSKTFASGNRLTHGQQGEIVGPATGNLKGKGLAMRFPGNIGTIDCKLNHLSASAPSTRA